MQSRLGPVLIQLPPGLPYDNAKATDFFGLLHAQYGSCRYAVEVRHRSWICDAFLGLLAENGIAFVMADSGSRFPCYEAVTADFVYMRFHGAEKLYASDYNEQSLRQYAEKINCWLGEGHDVWAFFNNDFGGFAVRNALRLRELVRAMDG
jgi:uncharacterized protein YecE (DUF72 family)